MASKNTGKDIVGVVGAGNFGTAIANIISHNNEILLYVHDKIMLDTINKMRQSCGQALAQNIVLTNSFQELTHTCKTIFVIVPSQYFKSTIQEMAPLLNKNHMLIHGTKGLYVDLQYINKNNNKYPLISKKDVMTMSELIQKETIVEHIGAISGPNLSHELSQKLLSGTVLASNSEKTLSRGSKVLDNNFFKVYTSKEIIGIELCGVLKNIIAIAVGCIRGLGYGENTKALVISRGIAEMIRIGKALGTSISPFIGLAGIGDTIATCNSIKSRNNDIGYRIAKGEYNDHLINEGNITLEGVEALRIAKGIVEYYQIDACITNTMYDILFKKLEPNEIIKALIQKSISPDIDFM